VNATNTTITPDSKIPAWIWLHSGLFFSAMQMDFNFDLVTLAIPLLAISLGASSWQLGLLGASQRLLYIPVCPLSGRFSDRWGRKGLAISGSILFGVTCLSLTRIRSVTGIAWLVPCIGVTLGLFWPALQGWLSDQGESHLLRRSTSLFNLFWSTGSMLGMVLAGLLMRYSQRLPFYLAAGVAMSIVLLLAKTDTKKRHLQSFSPELDSNHVSDSPWNDAQRRAALTSLFLAFLVIGGVTTQFPKLATQLGYSTTLIGFTMGFLPLFRTLGFLVFDRSKASPDISAPLNSVKLILMAAMTVLVLTRTVIWFMVAFALLGFVYAAIFSFSQYLCLKNPARAGRRIGYHESLMLGGIVLGSILSGFLAENFGFRVAFGSGILLSGVAFMAQPKVFQSGARPAAENV